MSDIKDDHKDDDQQDKETHTIVPRGGLEKKKTRTRRDPSPDACGFPIQEDDDECDDDSGSDRDSTSEDEEERERRRRKGRRHKRRKERKASPLPPPPPPPIIVPLEHSDNGRGAWDFLLNLVAMTVFAIALSLYLMPGTVTPFLFATTAAAGAGGPVQQTFHPEWPLHTFETAGKRKRAETKRAVHADSTLYKKVIETLSYHVLRDTNKRVLCMWHLQQPVSIQVANICVWKRRPPGVSIFSIGEPTVEEGMLLPMFNLEIKGYATNVSKTVSESSITCGRSRLVARKRRPVVDIAFETTTGKWTAVRLLVDEADETNAFALQQAWEESRGYMCDHDY